MDTNILLENGTNELEVLEFTIGGNHYGINVAKVREIINKNPYEYANNFSHYVGHKVIDAYECDWAWLWLYISLQVGGLNDD